MIGFDFLQLFTVNFDYPNGQIVLTPNTAGRKAFHMADR